MYKWMPNPFPLYRTPMPLLLPLYRIKTSLWEETRVRLSLLPLRLLKWLRERLKGMPQHLWNIIPP